MKLLDTIVIIGSLNPVDRFHSDCITHLKSIRSKNDVFVPFVTVLEADLVMKTRGYSYEERRISWRALEHEIPASKLLSNSVSSVLESLSLQESGMDYFDSLVASLALEKKAVVVTNDRQIAKVVKTEW